MTNGQTKIWNKKPQELKANPSHAGKPVGMARGGQDEKTSICWIRKIPSHSLQWQGQQGKRAHHGEPAGATALPPPGSQESQPLSRQGSSGASWPELTRSPCLLPYKNTETLPPSSVRALWMPGCSGNKLLHLGESRDAGLLCDGFPRAIRTQAGPRRFT